MSTQFGLDLRLARRKSGLTQADIAHLIDSHQSTVAALENGKWLPTIEQICLFSLVYGRSFESLYAEQLAEGRKRLRRNLPSLPETSGHTLMSSNREASLRKLEGRLIEHHADDDAT
ncbi:MAG: helix-turn-helix transcriptional regulator [Erythrobacter sp.]